MTAVVRVEGLRVELTGSGADIVDDVAFSIARGEILALVGETGSGKTTIATSLLGHASRGTRIAAGRVLIDDTDLLALSGDSLRDVRGRLISYVPQDPAAALNPALRIGRQIGEVFDYHDTGGTRAERLAHIRAELAAVGLPSDNEFLRRWPHQLSGGQQQRVCLAMAFLLRPRAIVLDEPTTGLDTTSQSRILGLIRQLCRAHEAAALYVTHDLAVVSILADRVLVLYAGRLAEIASRTRLFAAATHPYTTALLAAVPHIAERRRLQVISGRAPAPGGRPSGCFFAPRCPLRLEVCATDSPPVVELVPGHQARCHRAHEAKQQVPVGSATPGRPTNRADALLSVHGLHAGYQERDVVHGANFEVIRGECVALVGESGSGKTTLARAIVGLVVPAAGRVELAGRPLPRRARDRRPEQRRAIQYIFQNPYGSLNPRHTLGQIIGAPLRQLSSSSRAEIIHKTALALEQVGLDPSTAGRFPDELSGGERQRVAIARSLACRPDILICDEITSALDVSVQAGILDLLERLRVEANLGMLFITHNLAIVRTLADRVAVLHDGHLVEFAPTGQLLDHPSHAYTSELVRNTPSLTLAN